MRAFCAAAFVASVAAVTLAAGQGAIPIFRAGTTLVEFSIVATDDRGGPVTDLKEHEIAIVHNGKLQPVAFFRFEGSAFGPDAVEPKREAIAPGLFTNRVEYSPGPARNVTAIVIDTLNTVPEDQVAVKAQVMQYLRALAPNTRVAVYMLGSSLRVLHDFTDDLDALRARLAKHNIEFNIQAVSADELVRRQLQEAEHFNDAVEQYVDDEADQDALYDAERQAELDKARGNMARAEEYFQEQLHMRRINQTVASLEALGNHLAGIPGRKNMVWISGGLALLTQGAQDRWVNSYSTQVRGLAQRLATQGIVVYPVQAIGLQVGMLNTGTTAQGSSKGQSEKMQLRPMTRENDMRIWGTMDLLADVTGGRTFRNSNDLTAGVHAAATDMRGAYSVGFYVPENSDNRWREFDVRVTRPGVRVRHRKGYMSLAPLKQPINWSQSDWQAAMQNALGSTAIRLDARADAVANGLNVLIQIAADDLYYKRVNGLPVTDLEIGFGERNAKEWTRVRRDGATITIKENPQQAVKASIVRFQKMWTIEPDTTEVRLIVRDRMTGRFGVLDMPLKDVRR
ncbi:MAG TPA: VWA domain-containing protein [Vicinamibacterales bacterium]|nr:VWA domain-containing protein [Vicinamibacterales bacterium]